MDVRTILVDRKWFEDLEAYTAPDMRFSDGETFGTMVFYTPEGLKIIFKYKEEN